MTRKTTNRKPANRNRRTTDDRPAATGTFRAHPRGFGFLDLDAPLEDGTTSLFVPPPAARDLLDDDAIEASWTADDRGGAVSKVRRITARRTYVVGVVTDGHLQLDPTMGRLRLQVPAGTPAGVAVARLAPQRGRARPTIVEVVAGPVPTDSPDATRLLAVTRAATRDALDASLELVDADLADRALLSLLRGEDEPAVRVRRRVQGRVPGADLEREDLTGIHTVTVDGPSTKDLDDAVSALQVAKGVRIDVHIADVATMVGIGSRLDRRATTLATSTYLADHVAPMLPRDLSEGALSLLEGVERDTMTVSFIVRRDGSITDVRPAVSRIRSDARLTYQRVHEHLAGDAIEGQTGRTVDAMALAAKYLGRERTGRDTLTTLFTPAQQRVAVRDGSLELTEAEPFADATMIIERLMVAANEAVAGWMADNGVPCLYRVHAGVDPTRTERLQQAALAAGADVPALVEAGWNAADLAELMANAPTKIADAVAQGAADAMGRAGYASDPGHHFGLDSKPYTHFTSPIRRMVDLVVHRQLRAALAGEQLAYDATELDQIAAWIDVRAGMAARAEALQRNLLWGQWFAAELAAGRRPQMQATVRKLTPAGLLVRVDSLGVAGFIPAGTLPKRSLQRGRVALASGDLEDTTGRFRVGGTTKARLDRVDETGRLELAPAA